MSARILEEALPQFGTGFCAAKGDESNRSANAKGSRRARNEDKNENEVGKLADLADGHASLCRHADRDFRSSLRSRNCAPAANYGAAKNRAQRRSTAGENFATSSASFFRYGTIMREVSA